MKDVFLTTSLEYPKLNLSRIELSLFFFILPPYFFFNTSSLVFILVNGSPVRPFLRGEDLAPPGESLLLVSVLSFSLVCKTDLSLLGFLVFVCL